MTKQQKARAHLARAQELLGQGALAFGTQTGESDNSENTTTHVSSNAMHKGSSDLYNKLPKDAISQILKESGAENANGKRLRVLMLVSKRHREIIDDMLRIKAQDDQFLVNAVQDKDYDMARLLLQHRAKTPAIPKGANIIKMIAEALESREKLWAIMDTNDIARMVLEPIAIPKEWFNREYSAPLNHRWRNGLVLKNTDGLVATPDIQVFIRTSPESLKVDGGYLRTVRPLQCKVPVSRRTTVLDVCNQIPRCIPEAEGAHLDAYRAEKIEHHDETIIQRAVHPLPKYTPVILEALRHANDTLWIDVHLAPRFNNVQTVRNFIIRQDMKAFPERSYFRYLSDNQYLKWRHYKEEESVKNHTREHILPESLEELESMPWYSKQPSWDTRFLRWEILYDSKKQVLADVWDDEQVAYLP